MLSVPTRILLRIFQFLLIFCLTMTILLTAFFSQLRLEDYRQSLELQLSSALGQEVRIADAGLTFNRGPALKLAQLQVGPDDCPLVQIPQLTATLKLGALLKRHIILEDVHIEKPRLKLTLPLTHRPSEHSTSQQQLFRTLGIGILTIHQGSIEFYRPDPASQVPLKRQIITACDAVLTGWQSDRGGQLTVRAELPDYGAGLFLKSRLPSTTDPQVWKNESQNLQLRLTGLKTRLTDPHLQPLVPRVVDLDVTLEGIPAQGATFSVHLRDKDKSDEILAFDGLWNSTVKEDRLSGLWGHLRQLPFQGELLYRQQDKNRHLSGQLVVSDVELTTQLLQAWGITGADKLISGTLKQLELNLKKTWNSPAELSLAPIVHGRLKLEEFSWDSSWLEHFQGLESGFSYADETLILDDGLLTTNPAPVEFAAKITRLLHQPQIEATLAAAPRLESLLAEIIPPKQFQVQGPAKLRLQLQGPASDPDVILWADLDQVSAGIKALVKKSAGDKASAEVRGKLSKNGIRLDRISLRLNETAVSASGSCAVDPERWHYRFAVEPFSLEPLAHFSPLLRQLNARGKIAALIERNHNGSHAILRLEEVGAHLTDVLGELNHTNGEIQLDHHGLSFRQLRASLGASAFELDGLLTDWHNPQLSLDVRGNEIRSHDLIFPGRGLMLYDLNGHLKINRQGIEFAPVKVKLETDTEAVVNGSVTDFIKPLVELNISAERADILDVIRLFQGSQPGSDKGNGTSNVTVKISAFARQGTLGKLRFQNAAGVINDQGRRFMLYPLSFENGGGSCRARVEYDYREDALPLKVSGQASGVDASLLHQDFFAEPGLIQGHLDGDFYIEGNPAADLFWSRARGGIYFRVRDGVLRKFHSLAKIFSLLNVSQIFSGKLPDMNREGMPFSSMEGSTEIAVGLLTTEDLKITSEAMNLSLIGSRGLVDDRLDFVMGVMPLRTVDKVISSIPLAGWLLTGRDEALITAHFKVQGTAEDPQVTAIPVESLSNTVIGIFKRTLGLPGKLAEDIGSMLERDP